MSNNWECSKNPNRDFGFHEMKSTPNGRTFHFDPLTARQVSPTICIHCGAKGIAIIYDWDVKWESP